MTREAYKLAHFVLYLVFDLYIINILTGYSVLHF